MAEDQDKKPKATLIKHRKESSKPDESPEKKKVVVVKKKVVVKKSAPKVVAKKDESKTQMKPETINEEKRAAKNTDTASKPDEVRKTSDSSSNRRDGEIRRDAPRTGNKNFENRPAGNRTYENRPAGNRNFDSNRPAGNRPTGPRPPGSKPFDNRSQGYRPNYRDQNNRSGTGDTRQPYAGNRPPGPKPYNNNRTPGIKAPTSRPQGNRPPGNRPPGNRPPGNRPPGNRPPGNRPPGNRPQGGRPFQNRSQGGGFTPTPAENEKKQGNKKFFKSKKKVSYKKKNDQFQEKDFNIKKKQDAPKANPVPKEIDIMEVITVSELARKMNLKASELIGKLMQMGMMVTINQQIDAESAILLAEEYNCKVKIVSLYDETIIESVEDKEEDLKHRPPIVTVMGHVDHGKTKLLDAIRSTDVVAGEFGGITQHIGAYKVDVADRGEVVFLDTPGHEAFTLMRARGAEITDIVILVVAANDGVMPQTREAIDHAKDAKVPIIVAVNKIDLPEANPDKVKQQLSDLGLIPEDWGGTTIFQNISALKREGIEELLESVMLQAEMLELKANYNCRAEGKVVESKVDYGRGIVSSVIVEKGVLKVGDAFVAGVYPGKVRAMFNDKGEKIMEAGPATPVEILGFTGIPNAGDPFQVTESEKYARQIGLKRQELEKHGEAKNVKKVTLDNLYDSIEEGEVQELNLIIKGDVHGSVEALRTALEKLSTSEIRISVKNSAAGAIVENDINFAVASKAIIVGFHVRPTPKALALAEQEKVEIRKYNIIYDAVEDIKSAMEGMLAPDLKESVIGTIEVRDIFKVPKIGVIAGCYVKDGIVKRNSMVRVYRDGVSIHTGTINSLKRFKDDAKQVETGYECGIGIEGFDDLNVEDILEVYEMKEVAKKLGI